MSKNTSQTNSNVKTNGAITARERGAILQALGAGDTPPFGLEHLAVNRKAEIQALLSDLQVVKDGGASFRFLIGSYGVGKTFMEHLICARAIDEGFVVLKADLTVAHRLYATDGQARDLFTALMTKVFTKACPGGNGLKPLLESYLSALAFDSGQGATVPEAMTKKINEQLRQLKDFEVGFDFAMALSKYCEGHLNDNPSLQDAALQWLRAGYSTKTEARQCLGIRRIINDDNVYQALKVFAGFCRVAGFSGLLVLLDELSALTHRLALERARVANVQVLLTIINDVFQGGASGLGFVIAGTPETLLDPERGLFSVPALRSRLQTCASGGHIDFSRPVLRLEPLGKEELLVLLHNVRRVYALADESKYLLSEKALERFLNQGLARFARKGLPNPRDILPRFVSILERLEAEPGQPWEPLIDRAFDDRDTPDQGESGLRNLKLA